MASTGTRRHAGAAVDALVGMNIEHLSRGETRLVFARVDTIDRTHVDAGGVLGPDARLADDVGHLNDCDAETSKNVLVALVSVKRAAAAAVLLPVLALHAQTDRVVCDPALAALWTPRHPQLGRYEVCTTPRPLADVADPSWTIESAAAARCVRRRRNVQPSRRGAAVWRTAADGGAWMGDRKRPFPVNYACIAVSQPRAHRARAGHPHHSVLRHRVRDNLTRDACSRTAGGPFLPCSWSCWWHAAACPSRRRCSRPSR